MIDARYLTNSDSAFSVTRKREIMKRRLSCLMLSLVSVNAYAMNADMSLLDERLETIIMLLPWLLLFFITLNSLNRERSERFSNVLTMLSLLISIASFAWLFGYIEF